ncbi:hypothetical protein MKEN_00252400 [Mycena kentingensis (nom. inval.)]|nr:hypothetical protein MKEN_00252400 [Mycena kentingensis (nom. inval.)]
MHDRDATVETLLMDDLESNSATHSSIALPKSSSSSASSAPLQTSFTIVIFALVYTTLAVIAWAATCYLSFKPIGANHYGVWVLNAENNGWGWTSARAFHSLYEKSENWFRVARVLAAIVATLTIPVATSVCTRAAVAFHQRSKLTLRQTMALADRAWIEPSTWLRLLIATITGRGSFISTFLVAALVLNVLGGIIAPLQQIYLSTTTIKTPTTPVLILYNVEFKDHFGLRAPSFDSGRTTALLRDRLAATEMTDPQAQLWSRNKPCNQLEAALDGTRVLPLFCAVAGGSSSFGNMTIMNDPFFAQSPAGFSTGLIRQFLPRINSTARRENITADEFPKGCDTIVGAFYVKYAVAATDYPGFELEACMPADLTVSPWKQTRERQDFSEELFLKVSVNPSALPINSVVNGTFYSHITVNTSAGYFELPNYMNGEIAGSLRTEDPTVREPGKCYMDCEPQTFSSTFDNQTSLSGITYPASVSNGTAFNATVSLQGNPNKGPLLFTALALFGLGSYVDVRVRSLETNLFPISNETAAVLYRSGQCIGRNVPFMPLLRDYLGQSQISNSVDGCEQTITPDPANNARLELAHYLSSFVYNSHDGWRGERIQNAFTAAAFLANEAWFLEGAGDGQLSVSYDLGADAQIPVISLTGIIVVSVVLGLFILVLLAAAIYAWLTPAWTTTLDAFAMVRIGAVVGDPLRPSREEGENEKDALLLFPKKGIAGVRVLDETPGWVGDASRGNGNVGVLALGTGTRIEGRKRSKYRCD